MNNQNYKLDFFSGLLLFIGLLIGQSLAYALGLGLSSLLQRDVQDKGWFSLVAYTITMLVPIVFFDLLIVRKDGNRLRFDFSTKPFRIYLLIFPMMFGMMLVADYATQLIPTTGGWLGELYKIYSAQFAKLLQEPVSLVLMTVIIAPVLEEILFRGIIMKGMLNSQVKPATATVISAAIFGLAHFNPWQFVGAMLLGLVLGLVYYKTKSLLMSILLHAFNNLASAIMLCTDYETFSDLFHIKNEVLLLAGLFIFIIPFYFFAVKKNIIYKE